MNNPLYLLIKYNHNINLKNIFRLMSKREDKSTSKEKFIKLKAPLYFSPNPPKKDSNMPNILIEPKNLYQETEINTTNEKIMQKINNSKNLINIQLTGNSKNNSRIISGLSSKPLTEKKPQSYKKVNSKLYLKKNMIPNISALNYTEDKSGEPDNKNLKNRLNNIKFNIGKSSQNFLNSKISTANLKKNAGSAIELMENNNNYLKKSKTKNKKMININNINPINILYTTGNEKKDPISPPIITAPKIIFLKNEKSKEQIQVNENINDDDKKEGINCVLRNTFTNVKIYPTTYLNNKIIYQKVDNEHNEERKQSSNKRSENSNNSSKMRNNNSKIKKEKIVIDIADKNLKKINENNFQSIEEIHYFFVDTLQKGKVFAINLDKCNN